MSETAPTESRRIGLRRYVWALAALWTAFVATVLTLNLVQQRRDVLESARRDARAAFEKDIAYRRWAAEQGGVYVPVNERTPPSPYLAHIEERDVTTPSGRTLTLVNPAYMTRRVHELGTELYGLRGHITSLNPIRPENTADPWEAEALRAFERGLTEVSSVEELDGNVYMRLMRPLITEAPCLQCHAQQGYQVGDVRGGISEAVPMEPFGAIAARTTISTSLGYSLLWLLGLGGIGLATRSLRRGLHERDRAEEELQEHREHLKRLVGERTDELRKSEASLTEAQRIARIGNWDLDLVKNELSWSAETYRMFEMDPKEFGASYEAFLQVVHPDDRAFVDKAYADSVTSRAPYDIVHRLLMRDGRIKHVNERCETSYDERGKPLRSIGTVQDITERKQVEEKQKLEEERLGASVELSGLSEVSEDGIVEFALEAAVKLTKSKIGYLHFVNHDERSIQLYCWSKDVLKVCTAEKVPDYPLEKAGVWVDCVRKRRAVLHNDYHDLPDRKGLPDGHVPLERHLSVPILDKDKIVAIIGVGNKIEPYDECDARQLSLFIGLMWEILKRLRAEEVVRRSEADYRGLVEHATYGIYRSSVDDRFLTVNPALVEMLGYESEEELLSVKPSDVYETPEDRGRLIERDKDGGRIEDVELQWKRKDATQVTVRLSGRPMLGRGGRFEGFEMIVEDVTGQRKLEAQLRQAQKMEAVGQLTGGIAHDFNNILTVIMSNTELVSRSLPQDATEVLTDLEELRSAAERGSAMIKKLMGFSRQEKLTFQSVQLGQLVADMTRMFQRLLPESIAVEISTTESQFAVRADRGALEQILLNLATNARDAMPDGGVLHIEVRQEYLDPDYHTTHPWVGSGEYVCIVVSDTGIGMDEETKQRIFEPFYTTKEAGKGTGLGMAMIYGLVKQHGGFVHVYSELGEGTEVKLYFPVVDAEATVQAPARVSQVSLPVGTETILLVEDEHSIRRAAKRALEAHGYSVLLAADGEEALEVFGAQESEIDLIVSDLVMPKLGGRQLLDALRQLGKDVRIVFTSGYSADEVQESSAMASEIPFIQKPWALAEFLGRIREALDR